MSDAGPTTSTSLGQAVQTVWAGGYPRVATGKNGERHVIRSAAEEPHPEDERHEHDTNLRTKVSMGPTMIRCSGCGQQIGAEMTSHHSDGNSIFRDKRQGKPGLTEV